MKNPCLWTLLLAGCLSMSMASLVGSDDRTRWLAYSKCQPLHIPFCKHLDYNQTIYPNLLEHRNQMDAETELDAYSPLVRIKCHPDLTHFLCVLYAPVCTVLHVPIPPCRSLCLDVQKGCRGIMRRFGFDWPMSLNCSRWPSDEDGAVCIKMPNNKNENVNKPNRNQDGGTVETSVTSTFRIECRKKDHVLSIRKIRQSGRKCLTKPMKQHVTSLCQGHRKCRVSFASFLTAKCRTTGAGNLKIKYKCTKVAGKGYKSLQLPIGQQANLRCKGRREIRMTSASFGDGRNCDTPDAYCHLSRRCNNNGTCLVSAVPQHLASKCSSRRTTLQLKYQCIKRTDGALAEAIVVGYRVMTITCSIGKTIRIVAVTYGGGVDLRCNSDGIYCVVFALCNDKQRCVVPDLTFFKQKCSGSSDLQKLNVKYQCMPS